MELIDLNGPGSTRFFDRVRADVYHGHLTQEQVDGINAIHEACLRHGATLHQTAYILATADWETAHHMQPIREYGRGRGHRYGREDQTGKAPYGRGYVQLTWRSNYVAADEKLGLGGALAADYDLALKEDIAADILVRGMLEGWYGPPLTRYVVFDDEDFEAARHVVNAHDYRSYAPIAATARAFVGALKDAQSITRQTTTA